jgi:hypothetical protein
MPHYIQKHLFSPANSLHEHRTASRADGPEIQTHVKFVFKKFSTAIRVANVFGGVAARGKLQTNSAALEFCVYRGNSLSMRMVEPFRNAKNRREAAGKALIGIVERAVRRMITGWIGFTIVVTHDGGDEIAVAAVEPGNIAIEGQIFAVLVMAAIADGVSDIVKQGGGFKEYARFSGKMMDRLELIEELQTEFANVLGVAAVAIEAPREDAGSDQ